MAGNPKWVKGMAAPNPGGRPKGVAAYIREVTNNLHAQVHEAIRISTQGKSEKVRLDAISWLADRALGKALETHVTAELGAEGRLALLEGLTLDQLGELARGSMTSRVTVEPPRQIGSTSVVEAVRPVLQTPETAAPNTQTEGISDVPEEP